MQQAELEKSCEVSKETSPTPTTESFMRDLNHFTKAGVLDILKKNWAGLVPEGAAKLTALNEDDTLREECMSEFIATWNAADADSDGNLSRAEFHEFITQHNLNIEKNIGWKPSLISTQDKFLQLISKVEDLSVEELIGLRDISPKNMMTIV